MTFLVRVTFALLRASLALYPARYRREYSEERACVLQLALEEAAAGGWLCLLSFCLREWRDLPLALLREHIKEWRLRMGKNNVDIQVIREPGYVIWVGVFPFVLLGLMVASFEVPNGWGNQAFIQALKGLLMFGGYLVMLVGLLLGALAGFPRWSFPYLIYELIFALYISHASTPGLVIFGVEMWGRELWGWRAWVPLGIVMLLVPVLNRHPWRLLVSLWNGVAKNWSPLSFGLYGLLPLLMFISFDEMDNTYSFPGAVAGMIFFIIGAFLYLHLEVPFWRTFSLVAFAFLGILAVKATVHFYWDTHSINIITNERHPLEGPVPYASILAKAVRDAVAPVLILLLPGIGKLLSLIDRFVGGITKRPQQS